ncbi:MAG: CPBP family intramembrane glutamic endopeptidase, partial [Acidobacteriota bacterium]
LGDRTWAEAAIARARDDGEVDAETLDAFERLLRVTASGGAPEPFAPAVAERLEGEHGWFGDLAVALAAGEVGPVEDRAARTAVVLGGVFMVGLLLLAAGAALFLVTYRRWRAGEIASGYRRDLATPADGVQVHGAGNGAAAADRTPYLETLLLAIVGLQVLGVAVALLVGVDGNGPLGRWPLLLNGLLLPMLLWPLLRGARPGELRRAIGWSRGRGVFTEIGCGLLGYLTAAPVLLFGFLCSTLVAGALDQPPHHPILDWVQGASWVDLVLVASLAVLWAPVVEESLFRGVFYHYLRGRSGPVLSAFLVSLAFAAIHPQGLAGIPFLISLAMTLAAV